MGRVFIGIDVGTGSARAGAFDAAGRLLGTARHPIRIWHETGGVVEQSAEDIWRACIAATRATLAESGVAADAVAGIGFDATCSLVAVDRAGMPVSVSPSGDPARNVIVWMDHRASAEARQITETGEEVLRYVGGTISPEMQTPKLLWLKKHLAKSFAAAGHFFDLPDYLTYRATGAVARSACTVTCKWTYLAHERRWSRAYFERIGLGELLADGAARIGETIVAPGAALGEGLSLQAAADLGLRPGIPVGAALIDAHAGGIGSVGGRHGDTPVVVARRLGYIMGTSACIMATTEQPSFVSGVWGPYYSAMIPGYWLNEGGQSAAGAAIDHLVRAHPAFDQAMREASGQPVLEFLEGRVVNLAGGNPALLARDLHVLPEYLGNRSPFADPDARAVVVGLGLEEDVDNLARLFVAGLCGLAYGFCDVLDALKGQGVAPDMVVMSGGASHSPLVRRIMADATGIDIALPTSPEPVLLGAAMLGAVAARAQADIPAAMAAMSEIGHVAKPDPRSAAFHGAKRSVHKSMQTMECEARRLMKQC
ncbi:FGGY-family pentulose kinase [Dongia mobilis]|uniref:FGGY-family pentulose kinase n=1 Tax=Dongia mobilis TaxID=578943 RepID=A0A4R6WS07_9PROT|nr:FGGY-family carbohydrate kinase [Dongia mobilis]TDQ81393.1 FGGY-family pentulose kinase [Dongia mobilis]